jgi:hypothetical protein
MGHFRITRNNNKEVKQLLQAKLDSSLIEEVNLLCKWSGNEKNCVIAELLRYALSQESEFQKYRRSLQHGAAAEPTTILGAESRGENP